MGNILSRYCSLEVGLVGRVLKLYYGYFWLAIILYADQNYSENSKVETYKLQVNYC